MSRPVETESRTYVRVDEHGATRIGDTRVMLDSVVSSFEQGHSAETIQQQYPALALEEVYGAITYILAHQEEVRQYLTRQGAIWDRWRAKSEERAAPVVARLRESASAAVPEQR